MRIYILSIAFILIAMICMLHQHADSQANHLIKTIPQTDTLTVELPGLSQEYKPLNLILIEPGTYAMGSQAISSNISNAPWPPHKVTITRPFYISQYEITQAQYEALRGRKSNHSKHKGHDLPAEKVSWYDTQIFIKKLNHLDQGHFRLPTEAEWEYVCQNSFRYGVKDLDRGLAEWCEDKWQKCYPREAQTDPQNKGNIFQYFWPLTNRVFRGLNDGTNPDLTPFVRGYEQSIDYHYSIGFRIVREAD